MLWETIITFLVVFGLITSHEDYYNNKIRNRWIVIALVFGVVTSAVMQLTGAPEIKGMLFIGEFYINVFLAFLFGFILWYTGLWSGGDAKLFLAYSMILPPTVYSLGYIPHFPSFTLLINTFTPFLVFFFVYLFFKSKAQLKWGSLKKAFNMKLVAVIAVFIFGFAWVARLIFKWIGIEANFLILIVTLFIIIIIATRFLKMRLIIVSIILSLIRLIFDIKNILSWQFLISFSIMLLIFIVLRFYLLNLSYEVFSKPVVIERLKPGMIPAEDIYKVEEGKYEKRKFAYFSFIGAMLKSAYDDSILSFAGDGLSKKEVNFIKKIHSRDQLTTHTIRIFQTLPFAPFMFVGAIITLLTGMNIFVYIRILIESFL